MSDNIKPVAYVTLNKHGHITRTVPHADGWSKTPIYDSAALEAARQEGRDEWKEKSKGTFQTAAKNDALTKENADLRRQLDIEREVTAKAVADTIERCAKLCEEYGDDKRALYKGRHPYTGNEEGRADPYVDGVSDGALYCCDAIRSMLPKES